MKMNAYVAGVGMTRFGKHLDSTLKALAGEAICEAIEDAGIDRSDIQAAYMANAAGGVVLGQEMISGSRVPPSWTNDLYIRFGVFPAIAHPDA